MSGPQWEDCKVCGGDHWTKDHYERPPLPPRRCRHYHGVPGCRCQVSGIAGKPHHGPHHCDEHDHTWAAKG